MLRPMKLRSLALLLMLAACGGEDENLPADAPVAIDAAVTIDAPAVDSATNDGTVEIDAPAVIDAPSAVQVISCTGVTPVQTIAASNFAFTPANVTITAGDVIRVTSQGSHTFTSDTGAFDASIGADTCVRFTVAGSYPYHCTFHASMTGTVTVN